METIGLCPICKVGKMVIGIEDYTCNHFKSLDDKCGFVIASSYFGKKITKDIASQIIENGHTDIFNDLTSQKGNVFSAKLAIANGAIAPVFEEKYLQSPCPICQGKIMATAKGFSCSNRRNEDSCSFYFSKNVAGYSISDDEAEVLLNGSKTDFIEDFTSSKGHNFGAKLFLEEGTNEEGETVFNTKFDFEVIKCPKCKEGKISANEKAFGCSNWNNDNNKCDFTMWRNMSGKNFSVKEFLEFMEKGETKVFKDLKKKGGEVFSGKFVLGKDYKISLG